MAIKQVKVSDLGGDGDADYGVVIREYPGLDSGRILDVTKAEADALLADAITDSITVEVRLPDGGSQQILIPKTELDNWLGDPEIVFKNAAHLKGRRPGYSPKNGDH